MSDLTNALDRIYALVAEGETDLAMDEIYGNFKNFGLRPPADEKHRIAMIKAQRLKEASKNVRN